MRTYNRGEYPDLNTWQEATVISFHLTSKHGHAMSGKGFPQSADLFLHTYLA